MEGPNNEDTNRLTEDNSSALNTKVLIEYLIAGSLKNRVCRYCLCEKNQLVEVCETLNIQVLRHKQEVTIKEIICVVYPKKISQLNDLPAKICDKCIDKAISSYVFIQQCHMSEKSLTLCIDKLFQDVTTLNANYTRHNKVGLVLNIDHENVIDYASLKSNTNENYNLKSIVKCSKSKLDFNSIDSFLHHQKSHKSMDKYVCRTCNTEFSIYKLYSAHVCKVRKIVNANRNSTNTLESVMNYHFQCNCCTEIFSSWYNLIEHRDKHKLKKIVDCIMKGTLKENICRICLRDSKELVSIFQIVHLYGENWTIKETHVLSDIIPRILPPKVLHPLDMPSQICETCIQSAITSYVLDKQYRFSQSLLTACIDNILLHENNITEVGVNDDIREMSFSVNLDRYYKNMKIGLQFINDEIKIGARENISNTLFDYKVKDNASVVPLKVKYNSEAEKLIPNNIAMKVQILDSNIDPQDPLVVEKQKNPSKKKINRSSETENCYMKMHPCTMCIENFPTLLELLKHLKCHANSTSFLCRDCGNNFAKISALHLHASETHGQESYLYSIKRQSERQPMIEEVEIKKDSSKDSQSDIPSKNQNNVKEMEMGTERDHLIFEGTMCAQDFICQCHLDQNYDTYTPGSIFTCRICNQKFAQLHFLNKHELTHECQQEQSANEINSHGYYSCNRNINNEELHDEPNLLHKRKHCLYCKKNISIASYASHLLTHSDLLLKLEEKHNEGKKLIGKRKRVNETIKERERERESTPPETSHGYQCDKCPQVTSSKRTLMVHMNRVHLHVKPYLCHICDKAFYGPYHLKEHILIHSNTKPEICEICGNRFVNKMSLMYHKRLHTNERPHKCNECSDSFICATRLRNHVRKIHKPWDFICRFCERKFYDKVLMNKHINGVHLNIKRKRKCTTD